MKRKKAAVQAKARNGLVAALDIGTTKVCCLIARAGGDEPTRVVGIGHHASQGLRNGTLVDLDAAEATIRTTVEAAERMAGDNIRGVVVNVSTGAPRSCLVAYEVSVSGHEIGDADLRRILDPAGFAESIPDEHDIVHIIPVGYAIDGCRGVRDPRGMFGQRLGVNLHLITASAGAVRNLANCVTRCHLEIEGKVVSPYAAALGCLVEDETQLGVTLIDMGGGTTSVAVFFDSELIHTDSIPLGGLHVTRDLARGSVDADDAGGADQDAYTEVVSHRHPTRDKSSRCRRSPTTAPTESTHVPRSMLVGIIRPRVEEIFEMVRARTARCRPGPGGRPQGGADRRRRASFPARRNWRAKSSTSRFASAGRAASTALPEATAGAAFATCAGLLRFAANQAQEGSRARSTGRPRPPRAASVG